MVEIVCAIDVVPVGELVIRVHQKNIQRPMHGYVVNVEYRLKALQNLFRMQRSVMVVHGNVYGATVVYTKQQHSSEVQYAEQMIQPGQLVLLRLPRHLLRRLLRRRLRRRLRLRRH